MSNLSFHVFRPRNGAVLDLKSLQAIAESPHALLRTTLTARWPDVTGLVVHGLELQGSMSPNGPPGAVRPDAEMNHAVITPGMAVLTGRDGRLHQLVVDEPVHCPWPDATGPRVRGVLVLYAEGVQAGTEDGVAVARDELRIRLGFVRPDQADQPHMLALAAAVGNGQDWATDLARVLQPEHPVIQNLLKRFERLEQSVWKAEAEGSVWDRQVLGRSWVRYQTVAASALQAARMILSVSATTTLERVRVMTTLRYQLEQSVDRVATELLQIVGPAEGAGPYRDVVGARR